MTDFITQLRDLERKVNYLRGGRIWKAPKHFADRRILEDELNTPLLKWIDGDHIYTAEIRVFCGGDSVYISTNFTKDGRKTVYTEIKDSIHRMAEQDKEVI